MFAFDVRNETGETVFTLKEDGELFSVSYPEEMTHEAEMEWSKQFPVPFYNHCMYGLIQVVVGLKAYSPSELQRFLDAFGVD